MAYLPRLADRHLEQLLGTFPAVLVNGPRAVGKTTTSSQIAAEVVHLDAASDAAAFVADPDDALRGRKEPLLLDEWQEVPGVLGAVRRAVDSDPRSGRFILTGSMRAELEAKVRPATGRLVRLSMHGLTEREVRGRGRDGVGFLATLAAGDPSAFGPDTSSARLRDYVALALRSGFPDVVVRKLGVDDAVTWLNSYLDSLIARDAHALVQRGDPQRMRRYFEALALCTAASPTQKTLIDAGGVNARTATHYDDLFERLFVTEQLAAWTSNRIARLTHERKRYVVDPGLVAAAAGVSVDGVLGDSRLLGQFVDTLAMAQIRPEIALSGGRLRAYHARTLGGRQEIDLIVETGDGLVLAVEFKATAAPSSIDAKHLVWLRDRIGSRFSMGAVLHTGPDVFALGDRILAVPISAMWEAPARVTAGSSGS